MSNALCFVNSWVALHAEKSGLRKKLCKQVRFNQSMELPLKLIEG
ncbi:MAG: hypothetical protein ACLU63_09860 [Monoglobus pectinilyticus]